MDLNPDWREFFELFVKHEVEFMVVGAFALAYHGHPRMTGDVDIWVKPTPANARKVLSALDEFGVGSLGLKVADLISADTVIQIGYPPRRIDLLTFATGVEFEDAWATRETMSFGDLGVNVLGRVALIQNKKATGRPQDLVDVSALEGSSHDEPG